MHCRGWHRLMCLGACKWEYVWFTTSQDFGILCHTDTDFNYFVKPIIQIILIIQFLLINQYLLYGYWYHVLYWNCKSIKVQMYINLSNWIFEGNLFSDYHLFIQGFKMMLKFKLLLTVMVGVQFSVVCCLWKNHWGRNDNPA